LSFAWNMKMGSFGRFAPLDFYAFRNNKLVGLMELKTHPYGVGKYPTTQLNLRKWGWLRLYKDLGVKVLYLKMFGQDLYYIDVDDIVVEDAIKMGGCHRYVKSQTDIEPVIHIPVDDFKFVMQVVTLQEYERLSALDELKPLPKPKAFDHKKYHARKKAEMMEVVALQKKTQKESESCGEAIET
jgi:hypothetical protein